jgi:hypothetical protein
LGTLRERERGKKRKEKLLSIISWRVLDSIQTRRMLICDAFPTWSRWTNTHIGTSPFFPGNYSSCTGRSNEIICSSKWRRSGKRPSKQDETQFTANPTPPSLPFLKANVLSLQVFFWISPDFGPNSGFWCCVFLTLRKTLIANKLMGNRNATHPTSTIIYFKMKICPKVFGDQTYDFPSPWNRGSIFFLKII